MFVKFFTDGLTPLVKCFSFYKTFQLIWWFFLKSWEKKCRQLRKTNLDSIGTWQRTLTDHQRPRIVPPDDEVFIAFLSIVVVFHQENVFFCCRCCSLFTSFSQVYPSIFFNFFNFLFNFHCFVFPIFHLFSKISKQKKNFVSFSFYKTFFLIFNTFIKVFFNFC